MPMIDRVLSYFRKQGDPPAPPILNTPHGPYSNRPSVTVRHVATFTSFGGVATWTERDYPHLAYSGYVRNSDVYACVSLIAQTAKQVQWNENKKPAAQDSAEFIEAMGGPQFIESWMSYLLLAGNAYVVIGRNGSKEPVLLNLIQPDMVTPKYNFDGQYPAIQMWRVLDARGVPYFVAPEDMWHAKLFNPLNPLIGMAPLEAAMLRVDAQNEGATLLKRLFERGYAPGWIEAAKDSQWEEEQVAILKERMKRSKQSGEEIFLENATYHQMGFAPVDSGISEQQMLTKRDIASVFHVPPQLIGDTTSQTYSNYQEARRALYMEAVFPLMIQFVGGWNRTIGGAPPLGNGSELEVNKDSFEEIAVQRAEATDRVQKLFTTGLITQNEARLDLEYDPVDGGDVFYAAANFLPLAMDGTRPPATPPEPAPEPAPPKQLADFKVVIDGYVDFALRIAMHGEAKQLPAAAGE